MNKKNRRAIIAGNWKMNMLPSQAGSFVEELKPLIPASPDCGVAVCAPFVILPALMDAAKGSCIAVGAQNVSEHEKGAYTGEVSAAQLKDLDTKYVILGHSERREYNGETDNGVNVKAAAVLALDMTPIICVGESLEQRERGLTMPHIAYQVKAALYGLSAENVRRCIIAYEPIWAIGTGKTATADQAEEVCAHIRAVIAETYDDAVAQAVSILYGGSMNAANAAQLVSKENIDGGLIGGASLKPADFSKIIAAASEG